MAGEGWFRRAESGFILQLRVTPRAGRDAIDGPETRADGTVVLRLRVAAMPEKGRANAAVMALLARSLAIPRSSITQLAGQTSRSKAFLIAAGSEDLAGRIAALGR